MGFLGKIKEARAAQRLSEEALHAIVLREMEDGVRRDGLWSKALSSSTNDADAIRKYIHLRVQALRDEQILIQEQENRAKRQLDSQASVLEAESLARSEAERDAWKNRPLQERRRVRRNYTLFWLAVTVIALIRIWLTFPSLNSTWTLLAFLVAITGMVMTPLCAIALLQERK